MPNSECWEIMPKKCYSENVAKRQRSVGQKRHQSGKDSIASMDFASISTLFLLIMHRHISCHLVFDKRLYNIFLPHFLCYWHVSGYFRQERARYCSHFPVRCHFRCLLFVQRLPIGFPFFPKNEKTLSLFFHFVQYPLNLHTVYAR